MSEWTTRDDRDMECINEGYNQALEDFLTEMKREIHIEAYFMDRNFKHIIEDIAKRLTR